MGFKTVAAFKTVKSWGHMQYVILSYDIGKTSKNVLGPKKCWSLSRNHQSLPSSLSTLKSKAWPKNNHQDIVTSVHLLKKPSGLEKNV